MATHQVPLSLLPWEQDSFLRVKVEDEEASLSQVQERGLGNTVHPEAAHLHFRHFCYEEASNPHEALTQLHKLCRQWLQPEVHSKEQMLDLLVLEQFLGVLPPKIQAWVGAQCPKSSKEAAMLVEDLTQALDKRGVLTGDGTCNLSMHRWHSNQLSHPDRANQVSLHPFISRRKFYSSYAEQ